GIVGDRNTILVGQARTVRHLLGPHEILPTDVGRIQTETARTHIHEPFHHEYGLGPAGRAIGHVERLVRDNAGASIAIVRHAIGTRQVIHRVEREAVALRGIGAHIRDEARVDADDRAVPTEADTHLVRLLAIVTGTGEILAPSFHVLDR